MSFSQIDLSDLDFLLIEDNDFVRRLVTEMLRGFGAVQIRQARSADAASLEVAHNPPDMILYDWMSRPTDGLLFLRRLRANPDPAQRHIPVIMMTEHDSSDHIEAALGEGADSYIVKPFRAATLLRHLVKVIAGQKVDLLD